ncbi:hypothetical protein EWB00_000625 [Schistosoma japonicum]|uniref:Uncharacterized protein n=1 Tax=Schistosoma japonicum TaxID=6182 RepID=A0A4Z2DIC7_SCHJA|nr:hypothetical protein EWB00_000625 [Schistosoma japonicum]
MLYFNVFFLLVHSFSQDKKDVLKKLNSTLLSMQVNSLLKVQQNIQNTDHEVKNSTKRINKVLAPHGRTIDEYVKCKTNEFKAEEGLSTNTKFLKKFIPGTFHVYRKYLTDEDIHWKNSAEDRKTEYEKMALEHTSKTCDELADQFPEAFVEIQELKDQIYERQRYELQYDDKFHKFFVLLDIYRKVQAFDETHEEHKQ